MSIFIQLNEINENFIKTRCQIQVFVIYKCFRYDSNPESTPDNSSAEDEAGAKGSPESGSGDDADDGEKVSKPVKKEKVAKEKKEKPKKSKVSVSFIYSVVSFL